jgi:hypothetical protein
MPSSRPASVLTKSRHVNEAVRTGRSPLRPAGSADRYGVPMAEK